MNPQLYAVIINETYPTQCVVVWDRKENADALAAHLNSTIRDVVTVKAVDSFFPSDMCDADKAWIDATAAYLRGDHHNASN